MSYSDTEAARYKRAIDKLEERLNQVAAAAAARRGSGTPKGQLVAKEVQSGRAMVANCRVGAGNGPSAPAASVARRLIRDGLGKLLIQIEKIEEI
jgi:hypothetical protein